MKDFKGLKQGDRLKSLSDGMVLTVLIYRGEKFLAGERDMWTADSFDPEDWVLIGKGDGEG